MRRLIIVGVVLYALFVLRQFPADVAVGWFAPESVKLYGIDGSIWKGSAESIDPGVAGVMLGSTDWSVSPWWLLTGRAKGSFGTQLDDSSLVNTDYSKPFFGSSLHLKKVQGIIGLDSLPASLRPNQVNGKVGLSFKSLTLKNMWPHSANGSVDLVDLTISRPRSIELGSFDVAFEGGSNPLVGKVSDTRSTIGIDGTLTLSPDQSYLFEGNALASPEADRNVADALQFLGAINTDGSVALSFSGTVE